MTLKRLAITAAIITCSFISVSVSAATSLGQTEIGRLAQSLKEGEFRRLESAVPPEYERFHDFMHVQVADGRKLEIDGWTDTAHWDPKRQKVFFLGKRQHKKFISYDARTNSWEELGWAGDPPPQFEQFGRPYGRNALDWENGHYYHLSIVDGYTKGLYRYLIDEERWERMPDLPSGGEKTVAAVSMEWHRGMKKLILLDRTGKGHRLWAFDGKAWKDLGRSNVHGYHSQMQYNEKRGDLLIAGGTHTLRKVDLLTKDGELKHLPDAPFKMGIRNSDLVYDPVSGDYLYLITEARELWEMNPETAEWKRVRTWTDESWPFGKYGYVVPAPIDDLGAILWLHQRGPLLYRHPSGH
ncbi:hypothetical protein [Thauera phenolivorans]|uniref:hypothetical protein n=1 Tax=Thauera phenolivorans TaxID=1792543 RepID=UPI000839DC78|nr:hypothetical protein [Thauera phenolivorans]